MAMITNTIMTTRTTIMRMITVTTDRYLGQVELGMTAQVTYPYYGLAGGWSGIVVAWREKIGARRLELTLIG